MRPHNAAYATRQRQKLRNYHLRVLVHNGAGVFVDYTAAFGRNWVREARVGATLDQLVMSGSITLLREDRATGLSLSPTVASAAHTGGQPAILEGRALQILAAVTDPGVAPVAGDWYEVLQGEIDDIEYGKRQPHMLLYFRDVGARLLDKVIDTERPYGSAGGVPMPTVMQQILDDNFGVGAYTVYDRDAATFAVQPYLQEKKSVLEALNDLAAQAGLVFRMKYDAAGAFRPTLYNPLRDRVDIDAAFGPGEYTDLPTLKRSRADVRNQVRVRYTDATGAAQSVYVEDAASIGVQRPDGSWSGYGPRYMEIGLGATAQITTAAKATALANAALTDLKAPLAEHTTEGVLFWPAELGDRYQWTPNALQYDAAQVLAVTGFEHVWTAPGKAHTTINSRGAVAGAHDVWLDLGDVGARPREGALALQNFRSAGSDVDSEAYAWDASPIDHVDVYRVEQPTASTANPWPALTSAPTLVLPPGAVANKPYVYTVMRPTADDVTAYVMLVPRDAAGLPGIVEHLRSERLPVAQRNAPTLDLTAAVVNAITGLTADLSVSVNDPRLLGGTLSVIVHKGTLASSDPANDTPDGTLALASTPQLVGPLTLFALPGGGTGQVLRDVLVHASQGKRVAFKFVNSAGDSTGWQTFVLLGGGGIVDSLGQLKPGSITNAATFAAGLQPVEVYAAPLPARPDGTIALNSTDKRMYKRVAGAWVALTDAADLSGQISAAQIAAGAVAQTNLASGLKAVQVLAALPASGMTVGDVVYLTTDSKLYRYTGSAWTTATATTDLSGTISSGQLAAGAVGVGAFAAGLRPVRIVASLAAAGNGQIEGDTVYAQDTDKLYRWSGSAWLSSVPTTDLTGTISSGQLAAGAVGTATLATGLKVVQVLAALPASGMVVGDMVYLTTDNKLYRYTGSAWTTATATADLSGTISAAQLAATSVIAGKIAADAVTAGTIAAAAVTVRELAANSVTATQIAAGSIATSKLYVTDFTNLAENPGFEFGGMAGWTSSTTPNWAAANLGAGVAYAGVWVAELTAPATNVRLINANRVKCAPFDWFQGEAYIRRSGADGTAYMQLSFRDAAGVLTGQAASVQLTPANLADLTWARRVVRATAPALTAFAEIEVVGTCTVGKWQTDAVALHKMGTGELIVDGTITAANIVAASITATQLAANAVTAGKIAADAVTAGTIAAAAITARELAANSVTATQVAANVISASKLSVYASTGQAINRDPGTSDPSAWTVLNGSAPVVSINSGPAGGSMFNSPTSGGPSWFMENSRLPVDLRRAYRASCWALKQSANGTMYLGVQMLTASGTVASGATGAFWHYVVAAASPPEGVWTRYEGVFGAGTARPIPGDALWMMPGVILNDLGTAGYYMVQDIRIEEMLPSTLIKDGAITTDKLVANAVTAGKIAADAVTAGTIAAAAITAREIAAGAITTSKLAVGFGFGAALNSDPITSDLNAWQRSGGPVTVTAVTGAPVNKVFLLGNGTETDLFDLRVVPFDYTRTYRARMWVIHSAANGVVYPLVDFLDANGVHINSGAGTYFYFGLHASTRPASDTWSLQEVVFGAGTSTPFYGPVGIPGNAAYMRMGGLFNYGGSGGGYWLLADPRLEEVLPGTLIRDGAITTAKIFAGSVTAATIAAGAVTAGKIAADAVTAGTIAAGAVTASAINAGAVTAVKLSVSVLSEVATNAGTIVNGRLQNVDNTTYLDLSVPSGSSAHVLHHAAFQLAGDGSAAFSGLVYSTTFAASRAYFSLDLECGGSVTAPNFLIITSGQSAGMQVLGGSLALFSGGITGTGKPVVKRRAGGNLSVVCAIREAFPLGTYSSSPNPVTSVSTVDELDLAVFDYQHNSVPYYAVWMAIGGAWHKLIDTPA